MDLVWPRRYEVWKDCNGSKLIVILRHNPSGFKNSKIVQLDLYEVTRLSRKPRLPYIPSTIRHQHHERTSKLVGIRQ